MQEFRRVAQKYPSIKVTSISPEDPVPDIKISA